MAIAAAETIGKLPPRMPAIAPFRVISSPVWYKILKPLPIQLWSAAQSTIKICSEAEGTVSVNILRVVLVGKKSAAPARRLLALGVGFSSVSGKIGRSSLNATRRLAWRLRWFVGGAPTGCARWVAGGGTGGYVGGYTGGSGDRVRLRFTFSCLSKGTSGPSRQGVVGGDSIGGASGSFSVGGGRLPFARRIVFVAPRAASTALRSSGVRACHSLYVWYRPAPVAGAFTGV